MYCLLIIQLLIEIEVYEINIAFIYYSPYVGHGQKVSMIEM